MVACHLRRVVDHRDSGQQVVEEGRLGGTPGGVVVQFYPWDTAGTRCTAGTGAARSAPPWRRSHPDEVAALRLDCAPAAAWDAPSTEGSSTADDGAWAPARVECPTAFALFPRDVAMAPRALATGTTPWSGSP